MARLAANSPVKFKGKISNIVGVEWNGIFYIRAAPQWKKKYKATEKQLANQQKFKYANKYVNLFKQLLDLTVEKELGQTRASSIMQGMLKEAIVGVYPDIRIDYKRLPLAKGSLIPASSPAVKQVENGIIHFEWVNDSRNYSRDKNYEANTAMLIAFSETSGKLAYNVNGPQRANQAGTLPVSFKKGEVVHTWVSFRSGDFGLKANSVYAGLVKMI